MVASCPTPVLIMTEPSSERPNEPATSETVRVAADLMEMLRALAFHSRDTRGKRLKLTQIVDNILRPPVTAEYEKLQEGKGRRTDEKKDLSGAIS